MFEFLLYTELSCEGASDIADRIMKHKNMDEAIKTELVHVVKESTPDCPWDAND